MQDCEIFFSADFDGTEQRLRHRLALMQELQVSLSRGSRALVALDLTGMERETGAQVKILSAWQRAASEAGNLNHVSASLAGRLSGRAIELAAELGRSGNFVQQALRLHAALLRRSQHKLRVMANMLADPAANYDAPFVPMPAPVRAANRANLSQ